MTTQANRNADLVLELVQARRKLAAIQAVCVSIRADVMTLGHIPVEDVEAILATHQPSPEGKTA